MVVTEDKCYQSMCHEEQQFAMFALMGIGEAKKTLATIVVELLINREPVDSQSFSVPRVAVKLLYK